MKEPNPAAKLAKALEAEFSDARPDTVSALERGIAVLRCFDAERRVISHTELARMTGIPRPTVTRLAGTLVSLGLLKQDAHTERFSLAAGLVSLASAFLAGLDVRSAARPHMQAMAEQFGGSVQLAVRNGLEMVLVEAARPRASMIALLLDVGSRVPLPNTALGRAYLGAIPALQRNALMESLRLSKGSDWTLQASGLQRALDDMPRLGFCLSLCEFFPDVNSVSVPLVGHDGEVMSLNCGGAAYAFTEQRLREEIGPQLRRTADAIAAEIGGSTRTLAA